MIKYMDIKPVCPHVSTHYSIRKWLRSLPSMGWTDGPATILVVPNWEEPCQTQILTDGVYPPPTVDQILQSEDIGAALMSDVQFGTIYNKPHRPWCLTNRNGKPGPQWCCNCRPIGRVTEIEPSPDGDGFVATIALLP